MLLLGHESIEAVRASALELKEMGPAARRLLSECVEHQGCSRTAISKSAQALEDAGFVFIREIPAFWFLGIWIALQAWTGSLSLEHPQAGGGVAVFAHIGGFAFGVASGVLLLVLTRREPRQLYLR